MTHHARQRRDLVALVADNDIQAVLLTILSRPRDLGIRPIEVSRDDVPVHYRHDPACLREAEQFLRPLQRQYAHALVMLDRAGCGREQESAGILEREIEERLARSGWANRCAAVVIDPELEVWIWGDSPRVESCLGWQRRQMSLRAWLERKTLWESGQPKPSEPKAAYQHVLRALQNRHSPAIFSRLAAQVKLERCSDQVFSRLKNILQEWFPIQAE